MKRFAFTALLATTLLAAPAFANDEYQHNNEHRTRYELLEYRDNHGNSEMIDSGVYKNGRAIMLHRSEVADIQKALLDAGYNPGPVDGVLGHRTRGALANFQKHNDLNGNGRLTLSTLKALDVEIGVHERDHRDGRARNMRSPRHYN